MSLSDWDKLKAELDNISIYIDCPSCLHYMQKKASPDIDKITHYCEKFSQELPEEMLELGCGQGERDIPF